MDEIIVDMSDYSNEPNITKYEITRAIKSLKNRKSSGFDNITAEAIKAGGESMTNMLHKIFNKILLEEETPIDWSKMIVTLIHKNGNKLNPANYQAISLKSIPGKVFNHVLLPRIKILYMVNDLPVRTSLDSDRIE